MEESQVVVFGESVLKGTSSRSNSGNILSTIHTRGGFAICKSNLDYWGLKELEEKLETYVDNFGFE